MVVEQKLIFQYLSLKYRPIHILYVGAGAVGCFYASRCHHVRPLIPLLFLLLLFFQLLDDFRYLELTTKEPKPSLRPTYMSQ